MQRKLAAIVVADVVGYSKLMGQDETGTLAAFRSLLDDVVRPQVSEHQGRIFKVVGDGILAEFSSVVQAVGCAVKIQQGIAERNAASMDPVGLLLRIGVNLGDVIVEGDDIYGEGVNIAARLEAFAAQGGVAVSGTVYEHVEGKLDVAFEDQGAKTFKNIAEPVRVYKLVPVSGTPLAPSYPRQESSEKPAIVVLPFENLSTDPDQEFFCDGLTQDITTELCRFSSLFVISAKSAFSYKGRKVRAEEIGAELKIRYILEGSIQRQGDGKIIRVNAQLIDAKTGHHLWAQRFNKNISDLFSIQEELIELIVGALAPKLTEEERNRALRRPPESITAYEAFLRGTQHLVSHLDQIGDSNAAMQDSAEWFRRAIDLDSSYARAWGWLAYVMVTSWTEGWAAEDCLAEAKGYAEKAVMLEPLDHDTHWALACVYRAQGDLDLALSTFNTALDLNGNDADMLVEMAETLCCLGRHEEAARQIERAVNMNPHAPEWYRWMHGWVLYHIEDYWGSIEKLEKILRPNNEVLLIIAASYIQLGEKERAARALKRFQEKRPDWTVTKERQTLSYRELKDEDHWLEGLRKAGLPEN